MKIRYSLRSASNGYTSVNTAILGWLLEEVSRKSIADVLSERIWSEIGAEGDALIVVNKKGIAAAHGGMVTTLRDLARFGLIFTPSWRATSRTQIISDRFLRRITQNGRRGVVKDWIFGPRPVWLDHVAYQWDAITTSGAFFKGGFGGRCCLSLRGKMLSSRISGRTRRSTMWGRY